MSDVHMDFNIFDAVILSVFALSSIIAFFRGFLKELLSLVAWVGAAVATLYLFPYATEFMKHYFKNERLASGAGVTGAYIFSLITISILNAILIRYLRTGMEVGLLDNFLGLFFGALRGAFIVSLGYLILVEVGIAKSDPPDWLKTSITKQYLKKGANIIVVMAPGYLKEIEDIIQKERGKENDDDKDEDENNAQGKGSGAAGQKDMYRMMDSPLPQSSRPMQQSPDDVVQPVQQPAQPAQMPGGN